jgi:hypothetical protein
MRIDRLPHAGDLVIAGPAGPPPGGLRSHEVRDVSPILEGLIRPAGSMVIARAGTAAWLNCNGSATGWRLLADLAAAIDVTQGSVVSTWLPRGKTLAGLTTYAVIFDDLAINQEAPTPRPFGLWMPIAPGYFGASARSTSYYLDSGGVGGFSDFSPGLHAWTVNGVQDRYYFAWRASVDNVPNAAAMISGTLNSGAHIAGIGVDGSQSIANFVGWVDGTFVDLGVPIDTAPHVFEIWRSNGNTFFGIDGVQRGSVATPADALPAFLYWSVSGDAAAQRLSLDWYMMMVLP